MTLFTKTGCSKCDYIKEAVDLSALDINIENISVMTTNKLAHLAWHESVNTAQETMPILILDDCSVITGAINIKNYLIKLIEGA